MSSTYRVGLRRLISMVLLAAAFLCGPGMGAQEGVQRKAKKRVQPEYPPLASRLRVTGSVKIQVVISPDGKVKSTRVVGGHPLLIPAATNSAKLWEFEPAARETSQVIEFKCGPDEN